MKLQFKKMHGLGNDFVFFDMRVNNMHLNKKQIQHICNRQAGIGCDQLIIMKPSENADCKLIVFNPNGEEAGACGNATRCAVNMLNIDNSTVKIEVGDKIISGSGSNDNATINMGKPSFDWQKIPLAEQVDTLNLKLPINNEAILQAGCAYVGNPHLVLICKDLKNIDCATLGAELENHPLFPEGVNVNFAIINNRHSISLRVWERHTGLTLACGTGATATFAIAHKANLVANKITVSLPGGDLYLSCNSDEEIIMQGPVAESFNGEIQLS